MNRRRLSFVALLLVLAVALAIGSTSGSHPTNAQRAAALDARLRCPSCEDATVAQSSASSAVAVRHQVASMIANGATDAQIESSLESRYGPSILLVPPARGLASLVWFVPVIAGVVAVGWVGTLFWRRSRQFDQLRQAEGTAPTEQGEPPEQAEPPAAVEPAGVRGQKGP